MTKTLEFMIISTCLRNIDFFNKIKEHLSTKTYKASKFEDTKNQIIFNIFSIWYSSKNRMPTRKEVQIFIEKMKEDEELKFMTESLADSYYNDEEEYDIEFLQKETEVFIKQNKFTENILLSQDAISKNEFDVILENMIEVNNLTLDGSEMNHSTIDKKLDLEELDDFFKSEIDGFKVPSMYSGLDKALNGGFKPGKLYSFAGQAGGGKSIFLLQIAINAIRQGYSVLFVSMEMDAKTMNSRFLTNILPDTPYEDYQSLTTAYGLNKDIFFDDIKLAKQQINGKLDIFYPTEVGLNSNCVEKYMKREKYDIVIIDYVGIMSTNKGDNEENSHQKYKAISEELRSLAKKHEVPVITANQLNADGYKKQTLNLTNVAYSLGFGHTMDFLAAITPDGDELQILKNRDGINNSLKLTMNKAKYKIIKIESIPEGKVIDKVIDSVITTISSEQIEL